ncbi:protein kinase domain-containing protein [Candidatus Uabimicrobium amorphum]|uniref:non-specific serine/threonine protein kinase n=1 Tax=Uabimicrobium amorphum TaxID=2596890 RepID=A0A5S9F2M6_UABAM|nr:serine/threonine-protein kinase [Candidatus Uabimicrobium amorphum]BBM82534.1 protein kinase [Candidatus Uabimicrobium amorphum]
MNLQDKRFLEKALSQNFIDDVKIRQAAHLQQQQQQQGKIVPIHSCLVHLGFLSSADAKVILEECDMEDFFSEDEQTKFGRYNVHQELGQGGMGKVFKAYDPHLQRMVALKMLIAGSEKRATERFMREARATANLKHPNIITLYDIGIENNQPYFTMELIKGKSLKNLAKKEGLSNHRIAMLMLQVADAIHYAHKQGVVHRDLKPENIMMNDGSPIVMDFGIAKIANAKKLSQTGMLVGTLQYMAPEQASGRNSEVDERSDVYALGAILYELLTGHTMFSGGSHLNLLHDIIHRDPIPPSKRKKIIARDLESICLKALEKQKAQRYQSAKAFANDLRRFTLGEVVEARAISWQRKLLRKCKRHSKLLAVIIFTTLTTTLAINFLPTSQKPTGVISIHSSQLEVKALFKHKKTQKVTTRPVPLEKELLQTGKYDVTFSKNNYFPQTVSVEITPKGKKTIDCDLRPMILWQKNVERDIQVNGMTLANIDGSQQLLFSDSIGKITSYSCPKFRKKWDIPLKLEISPHKLDIVTRDLNKDGVLDIIVPNYAKFMIFDGKTKEYMLHWYPFWGRNFTIIDVNDDGYEDVVLFAYSGIHVFLSQQGTFHAQRKYSIAVGATNILIKSPQLNSSTLLCVSGKKIIRVDLKNKKSDIIYQAKNRIADIKVVKIKKRQSIVVYDSQTIFTIDSETFRFQDLIHTFDQDFPRSAMNITDIDKDSQHEILIHTDKFYCIDLQNKKVKWAYDSQNEFTARNMPVFVVDFDQDHHNELITWSRKQTAGLRSTTTIYITNDQGKLLQKTNINNDITSMVFVDTNNNNKLEAIFLANDVISCLEYLPPTKKPQVDIIARNMPAIRVPLAYDLLGDATKELLIIDRLAYVHCVNAVNRQSLWKHKMDKRISGVLAAQFIKNSKPQVFIVGIDHIALLSNKGQVIWQKEGSFNVPNPPIAVDVNRDGCKEILFVNRNPAVLHCIDSQSGKTIWQSKQYQDTFHGQMKVEDVDDDGQKEIFLIGIQNTLYCFNGSNGNVKWQKPTPSIAEGGQITTYKMKNGKVYLFVGQEEGFISCFDANTGEKYWHKNILSTNTRTVATHNIQGRECIVFSTINDELFCLDANNGEIIWQNRIKHGHYFANVQQPRGYAEIIDLNADLDNDGVNDFITTCSTFSFYIFSGKDGKWMGQSSEFTTSLKRLPRIYDVDSDQKYDMLLTDRDFRLICIYDIQQYLANFLRAPQYFTTASQNAQAWYLKYFDNLVKHRRYVLLKKELSSLDSRWANLQTDLAFYNAIVMVSQQKPGENLEFANHIESFELDVLQMIAYANAQSWQNSSSLTQKLLQKSIMRFDATFLKYRHLLHKNSIPQYQSHMLQAAKPHLNTLQNIYEYEKQSLYQNIPLKQLLEVTLRYADKNSAFHRKVADHFIRNIFEELTHFDKSFYTKHRVREILDYAIANLPNAYQFREQRAMMYLEYMHYQKAAQDLSIALKAQPQKVRLRLYLAIAYMGLFKQGKMDKKQVVAELSKISFASLTPQEKFLWKIIHNILKGENIPSSVYQNVIFKRLLILL